MRQTAERTTARRLPSRTSRLHMRSRHHPPVRSRWKFERRFLTRFSEVNETDAVPPVAAARVQATDSITDHSALQRTSGASSTPGLPMMYTRRPPISPVLKPEYRYCGRDGFVKPLRAHHCRACGTVRLTEWRTCVALTYCDVASAS